MKTIFTERRFLDGGLGNVEQALTLVEMIVTMALFSLVVIAFTYAQIFGMRQDQLVQSKLGASDQSRHGFSQMADEIRSAKIWSIGSGNASGYTATTNGFPQQGTAVQLCLSTNKNIYILYYFDTSQGVLYRTHSPANSSSTAVASNLISHMYFVAEDYRGDILTNRSHKSVIHTRLQFSQYQYPLTWVGSGYYYDSYKMEFRTTPHVPDGQ